MLSAYSIIMILIIALGIISHLLPKAEFVPVAAEEATVETTVEETSVETTPTEEPTSVNAATPTEISTTTSISDSSTSSPEAPISETVNDVDF